MRVFRRIFVRSLKMTSYTPERVPMFVLKFRRAILAPRGESTRGLILNCTSPTVSIVAPTTNAVLAGVDFGLRGKHHPFAGCLMSVANTLKATRHGVSGMKMRSFWKYWSGSPRANVRPTETLALLYVKIAEVHATSAAKPGSAG